MRPPKLILPAILLGLVALAALPTGLLAHDHDHFRADRDSGRGDHDNNRGVPGPLAGAGLPILAVGYGAYWLIRRYRRNPN
jgi:hypothetical protein